jgi:hypothetical protein
MASNISRVTAVALVIALAVGCASKPQIAVDPRTIANQAKYEQDLTECTTVAENYDLTEGTAKTAIVGAAAGGGAAAGVATAIAGAIFWPAIPFIAGAALVVGTGSGGVVKVKEADARETILSDCMTERGYKTYKATNTANAAPNPQAAAANIAYKPDGSPLAFSETDQPQPKPEQKNGMEKPPKSNFAKLEDVNAVPNLDADKKRLYKKFLTEPLPRAFAISEAGQVGWASRGEDPLSRALYFCQIYAKNSCTLYAVDNDVVYIKPAPEQVNKPEVSGSQSVKE